MNIGTLLAVVAGCIVAACGKPAEDLAWKQEVPLQDGRMIVLDRLSHIGAEDVLMRLRMETAQTLTFTHPDTGQRIEWAIPKGLLPYMLDFDQGVPYYVLDAHTVGDYNTWKCPNPPYMVFKYVDKQWQQIPFDELPIRFSARNLLDMAKDEERHIINGYVTRDELNKFLKRRDLDRRTINRNKINPIAEGCHGDTLQMQGRQSEIDYRR